jgi:CheY-like chemotaxis protein
MKNTVVAIFEDDQTNQFVYEKIFAQHESSIQVYIFNTPEEGLEMAKQIQFDVVFIEIHFWESFGGISILNTLKNMSQEYIIAVGMTSLLQEGDLERAVSAGFAICLEKPIAFQQILPLYQKKDGDFWKN